MRVMVLSPSTNEDAAVRSPHGERRCVSAIPVPVRRKSEVDDVGPSVEAQAADLSHG